MDNCPGFQRPYLMSDGRLFTDWRPNCSIKAAMKGDVMNSEQERIQMMVHAKDIMKENKILARKVSYADSIKWVHPDPFESEKFWKKRYAKLGAVQEIEY